jgi:hypothetical protein
MPDFERIDTDRFFAEVLSEYLQLIFERYLYPMLFFVMGGALFVAFGLVFSLEVYPGYRHQFDQAGRE